MATIEWQGTDPLLQTTYNVHWYNRYPLLFSRVLYGVCTYKAVSWISWHEAARHHLEKGIITP